MKKDINIFTLFSGYDSQLMALNKANEKLNNKFNINLVGWSDIDPKVQVIHNITFPEYKDKCYPDVTKIDWNNVKDFDILFYSSPCQSVSKSGKRDGITKNSNTESSLLWSVERAIASKRPKYCIMENVEGLLETKHQSDLEFWLRTISSYGYRSFYKVLCSADYQIPQNRKRFILVSVRIDNNELIEFKFPEREKLTVKPVDLLSKNIVDDKYYLTIEETEMFFEIINNANNKTIYTTYLDTKGKHPTRYINSQFTKKVKEIVTPLCANDTIPTLMSSINKGTLMTLTASRRETCPCVIEIWESNNKLTPVIDTKIEYLYRKIETIRECKEKTKILSIIKELKENQYIRIRRFTPEEYLRFMGVDDKYIYRMLDPYKTLINEGYTENDILKLITVKNKIIKLTDNAIYGRAGNSIVVHVLVGIFEEILNFYSTYTENKQKMTSVYDYTNTNGYDYNNSIFSINKIDRFVV